MKLKYIEIYLTSNHFNPLTPWRWVGGGGVKRILSVPAPGCFVLSSDNEKKFFQNIYSDVTISARTVSRFCFFGNNVNFIVKKKRKEKQYNNKYLNKWKKKEKCKPSFIFLPLEGKRQKLQTSFFFIRKLVKFSYQ